MRVYLPGTFATLRQLLDDGELAGAPLAGAAVTPALREWYASGDAEELEYAALTAAARLSLRRLAAEPDQPRRRVVVAADVPSRDVAPTGQPDPADPAAEPAAVRIAALVRADLVAAVHVDDPAAEPEVAAAVGALAAADLGDPDAQFAVDAAEAHELQWYAVGELNQLLAAGPEAPRDA